MASYDMGDYVDVADRIRQLREKHPEAVLRPWNPAEPFRIMEIGGREFIVYTAACYRTPDDPMPAVAVAAEPAIGKTNFTRDSEVMNAETSAWGRCIVACLAADTKKIASLDEVRNRKAEQAEGADHPSRPAPRPFPSKEAARPASDGPRPASTGGGKISEKQTGLMMKLSREKGLTTDELKEFAQTILGSGPVEDLSALSSKEASSLISGLMGIPS